MSSAALLAGAHGVAVPVVAVPPAVAAARVEQRAGVVAARVPEHALGLVDREAEPTMPVVRWVREVQVDARVVADAIPVRVVVAHRDHALATASVEDVVLVHRARDTHLVEPVALPCGCISGAAALLAGAHGVAVPVVAVPPAVAAARVEQRAGVVAARVPEHALGLVDREAEPTMPVVRWVREVQVDARVVADAIPVRVVVAHRDHALAPASVEDVVLVHRARDTHLDELVALPYGDAAFLLHHAH